MIGFPFFKDNYAITPLSEKESRALHEVHKRSFLDVWDTATFSSFLSDPHVFGYVVRLVGQPDKILGFVLCRLVVDEAEIITIAVHPSYRGRGIGQKLMDSVFRHLYHERATVIFLEVDETNKAAIRLYKSFGFEEVGRRQGYYQTVTGRNDALVMRRSFQQTH